LISAGMKFRNNKKFRYGIPAHFQHWEHGCESRSGLFKVKLTSVAFAWRAEENHKTLSL